MTKLFKEPRRIHFVGIGGVGMSGIAEVLLTLGHRVSGSDMSESDATRRLTARGAVVTLGHRAEAVNADVDVVVISSAVKYSNPEVVQARALKIPVIPRAEMLAELMRLKYGIAVAGTHGKTTTTSLIAAILARAGLDPTTVIGGKVHGMGTNARLGQGELLVAEADESDGTFLMLSPVIAVVTNIDPEHLDYYGDMDRMRSAFLEFMNRVPFYGVSVLCLDSVNVRSLLPQVRKRVITYGTTDDCEYVARDLCVIGMETMCEVVRNGKVLGTLRLRLPGRHHALNAVAAIAVAEQLGVPFETACEALGEFLDAFDDADHLVLTDIYAAGEEPVDGLNGEVLFWALKRRGHLEVSYVPKRDDLVGELRPMLQVGDMVVVLGAGNIHGIAEELVHTLVGAQTTTWTVQ